MSNKTALVLIHGYLESDKIWESFIPRLQVSVPVKAYNIPGHGEKKAIQGDDLMQKWADDLHKEISNAGYEKIVLVGHSMGGYLAGEYALKYPETLAGICFFHSVPFADSGVKIAARRASVIRIEQEGTKELIREHAPKIYANANTSKFAEQIEKAVSEADKMSKEAVIASLKAMMYRKDPSEKISELKIPVLFLHGKQDNFIADAVIDKFNLPEKGEIFELHNSGHAAFNEEPEKAAKKLSEFTEKCL